MDLTDNTIQEQLETWHLSEYVGLDPSIDSNSAGEWEKAIKHKRKTLFGVSREVKDGSLHARIMKLGTQKVSVGELNSEVVRVRLSLRSILMFVLPSMFLPDEVCTNQPATYRELGQTSRLNCCI